MEGKKGKTYFSCSMMACFAENESSFPSCSLEERFFSFSNMENWRFNYYCYYLQRFLCSHLQEISFSAWFFYQNCGLRK